MEERVAKPPEYVAGRPFRIVRDFLRRYPSGWYFNERAVISRGLTTTVEEADVFLRALVGEGYIEQSAYTDGSFQRTAEGNALCMKSMRRLTPKKAFSVKEQVAALIKQNKFCPEFVVTRAAFFGSIEFDVDQDDFGDIDVAIEFSHSSAYSSRSEALEAMDERLQAEGYNFRKHSLGIVFPEHMIIPAIRRVSPGFVSVHTIGELDSADIPYKEFALS